MTHVAFAAGSSAPQESLRVLIVGAGPCGLSVAKALQNSGIIPELIEKGDQIRSDGAGIAIPANGSWALEKLGIDIASKALRIRWMQFTDDQGEVLIQEEIDQIHPDKAQFYSIGRDELMEELLASLHPEISIRTSVTVKRFSEEGEKVKVEFSDGTAGDYDLVIGCDGLYSSLRGSVHPGEVPEFLGLLVWRTVIDDPVGVEMPTYMLGPDRLFMLYPMKDQRIYVYGHLFQQKKEAALETFAALFASFGGQVPEVLDSIIAQGDEAFYIHHMEKSQSVRFKLEGFKRILLAGDAAHGFGPMLQNGAAQAFEDAYVVQEMAKGLAGDQVPLFIDSFAERRKSRVETVYSLSNVKIQAISNPAEIQGRNDAIRNFGAPNVNGFKLIMRDNP